jgi:cytochrome c-type biogenesis protein CcmH/NrfG
MERSTRPLPSDLVVRSWTALHAYVLAAICLVIGVAFGYLFRGSATPPARASISAPVQSNNDGSVQDQAPSAQANLAQSVAPYLEALKGNPEDYDSLVNLGDLYYDAQQFSSAIQYYGRALAIHPENPDVRTDMGTAYWYSGNAERALTELETALKYRPDHPQSLFNIGWVKWQGKADAKGAVEAWQKLLKTNPNYPQRELVQQYITKAKEHADRG